MKGLVYSVSTFTILFTLLMSPIGAQDKQEGVCFIPVDKEVQKCIDFDNSWYFALPLSSGWLLNGRPVNTPALPHIWNGGQYLISNAEWSKVESALSSKGLAVVCPPPSYRFQEDVLKPRSEICKK